MSFLKSKHSGWTWDMKRTPFTGGGGGGSPAPTTSYTQTSNIPDYAQPYVENMLQSAQTQVYNDDMTSFRPYTPYSTDVNNYFAGFSPLQQSAQQAAWNMQVPGQYGLASGLAGAAGIGSLGAQDQASYLGSEALGYGQTGSMYGGLGAQQAMQAAQQTQRAAGMYGRQGAQYGGAAAGLAPQAQTYGQEAADIGMGGLGYGALGSAYGQEAAQRAQQGYGAGAQFAQQATSPEATRAYMSPYMQNVVDYEKSQAARDFGIAQTARQAKAVGAGAFGGSRQAIENAEAQRSLMSQLQGIEATGAQKAFEDAQRQQQFGANLGLQGLQAGYQGTGMGIQGAQAGLAGLGTAMQGQQAGLAGLGQAGSLYGQGMQGSQVGLQGVGAQQAAGQLGLAGTAQGMQGAGYGLQGVQGALGAGNYGLAGYGMANQAAGTLGQLGTQDLSAQQSIANLQNTFGAQQQALEQNKINQAIQDYAIQQQYPMMQLGFLSNMLRGLPMQAQTTQMYQAQPSPLQQGIGLVGAGASLLGTGRAEGGEIKEMAEGGIAGYKYGGAIPEAKLAGMAQGLSVEQLKQRLADKDLDSGERQIFADALQDKARLKARSEGIAAAGGGLFNTMGYAGGGILAFAEGDEVKDPEELANQINLIGAQLDAINKEAAGKNAPGSRQKAYRKDEAAAYENLKARQDELKGEYAGLMSKAGIDKPAFNYQPSRSLGGGVPTNSVEQAMLGTKPPAPAAQPTAGEFQAFDEATQRYLAEQKTKAPGAAGPTGGAEGSKAYGAAPTSGAGSQSGLGGILAGLRKEGPQGELGADYLEKLRGFEAGADQRLSRADKIAMAKGFLKFGSTPAPGGIGQAAVAGLGEYTEGYSKALESDEKFRMENAKLQSDIENLRRAEERGDVKLAAELQEKIADRANRLQTAQISAAASGRTGAREEAYVKQLMAQGMSLEQALQAVKGAGRAESNDITRVKTALAELNGQLTFLKKDDPRRAKVEEQIAQLTQMLTTGIGAPTATAGVPKDIQGILNKYQ